MDRMSGSQLILLAKSQRVFLGLIVLILVDVIWVSSSELTKYIYNQQTFNKPFFCTYVQTSMFTIYLFGFLFWPPWRDNYCSRPTNYTYLPAEQDEEGSDEPMNASLSNPIYVPVKVSDRESFDKSSGTESDDSTLRSVRFSKVAEVRHLSEVEAADALLARLSYQASLRASEVARQAKIKLPLDQVSKVAFIFCLLWFVANYTYQMALLETEAGVVNILSSTSSFFTLILAAMYPTSNADRFTVSKLVAVLLSLTGIALISFSDLKLEKHLPWGAALSLASAFFYAAYLVFLKRRIQHEEKIDIAMFFGFVGLFNLILLWPVFYFLHVTKIEIFEWPTKEQMALLLVNGLVGTVISEALWLWGCFLTSPLMATVAISLTIPMTMMADIILKHIKYLPMFYFGTVPLIVGFLMVTAYSHFDNWDPISGILHRIYARCRQKNVALHSRFTEPASEQNESLIGSNGEE